MTKTKLETRLTRYFMYVYQKGIMFGRNNCDKNTELISIRMHVNSKGKSFYKLAKKTLNEME